MKQNKEILLEIKDIIMHVSKDSTDAHDQTVYDLVKTTIRRAEANEIKILTTYLQLK